MKTTPQARKPVRNERMGRKIKAALIKKGITQTAIAEEVGVTVSAVSHVINGRQRMQRVEAAVAKAIGRSPEEVFPSRQAA